MSIQTINSADELTQSLAAVAGPAIVAFFGDFSAASKKAQPVFESCCKENGHQAFMVDVAKVKGLHKQYGVDSVPTVVLIEKGEVRQRIVGPQTQAFYARALLNIGEAPKRSNTDGKKEKKHRVVVYVSNSCPWCTKVKNYLRRRKVRFSEINVSNDEKAAQSLMARTGQSGVPQLDIDGQYIVGFDQPKIDKLLGLAPEH